MRARWWNRLAARICEHLHDLAMPAWQEEVPPEDEWEDPLQDAIDGATAEAYAEGWADAERSIEERDR